MIVASGTRTSCLLWDLATLKTGASDQTLSLLVFFASLRELPGAAGDPIPQGTSARRIPAASAQGIKVPPAAVP